VKNSAGLNLLQSVILTAIFFILPSQPSRAAALNDVAAVPHLDGAGMEGYRGFLAAGKFVGGRGNSTLNFRCTIRACRTSRVMRFRWLTD